MCDDADRIFFRLSGIGQRISQYGITEQRYLVAACALWFAILIVSNLIKRQQFKLQFVTISLALLCLLASFGPWGIYQLPINSQFERLESILIENKLLIDGKLDSSQQANFEVKKEISSIVTYLVRHDAALKLRPWIKDQQAFDDEFICKSRAICHHFNGQEALELMGFEFIDYWQSTTSRNHRQITLRNENSDNQRSTFNIRGYDFFIPIEWLSRDLERHFILTANNGQKTKLSLNLNDTDQLLVSNQQEDELVFNLSDLVQQFSTSQSSHIEIKDANKLTVSAQGKQLSGKLYLKRLNLRNKGVDFIEGHLLIKIED